MSTTMKPMALRIVIVSKDRESLGLYERQIHRLESSTVVTVLKNIDDLLEHLEETVHLVLLEPTDISERGGQILPLLQERQPGIFVALFSSADRLLDATVQQLLTYHRLPFIGQISDFNDKDTLTRWLQRLQSQSEVVTQVRSDFPELSKDEIAEGLLSGALTLYYQPKVRIIDGSLLGFEALARWNKDGAILPPVCFVPLAEREGLIKELTRQVVALAANQVADWILDGEDIKVSVNITADDLEDPAFVPFVREAVAKSGIPADRLVLEVTESKIGSDMKQNQQSLAALKAAGFELAIDDFGTGYSSLEQLHRMPINELKIDRAFVFEAWNVDDRKVILSSSIGMGQQLGLHVVAEGAETLEDWRLLEELQAEICQGYFVGRPMPVEDVPSWRESWQEKKPTPIASLVAATPASSTLSDIVKDRPTSWGLSGRAMGFGAALLLAGVAGLYMTRDMNPSRPSDVAVNPVHAPSSAPSRLAIIPFDIVGSADQSLENMSLSIAEELITTLAGAEGLTVMGRESSLGYDATNQSAMDFGKQFRMDQVIEGRLIDLGEQLQVTVRATSVSEGTVLWAERFDLDPDNFLSLREAINTRVSQRYGLLPAEEFGDIGVPRADKEAAFKLYLTGRQKFRNGGEANLEGARVDLQKAISLDPSSVNALALLARITIEESDGAGFYGKVPVQQAIAEARSYVRLALELDPNHAEAHLAQGLILGVIPDYAAAIRAFDKTLSLDPTLSTAHRQRVLANFTLGYLQDAISAAEALLVRDPLSVANLTNLATMQGLAGNEARSESVINSLKKSFSELADGPLQQATLDIQRGEFESARMSLMEARAIDSEDLRIDALMALLGIQSGDYALVREQSLGWYAGRAMLGAGENDAAVAYVDETITEYPGDTVAFEDWLYVNVLDGRYDAVATRAKTRWTGADETLATFDYTYLPHPIHLIASAVKETGDTEYFTALMATWKTRIDVLDANGWKAPAADMERALYAALSDDTETAKTLLDRAQRGGFADPLMVQLPAFKDL